MTSTEARTRVKFKFGIPSTVTTFDDDIDESVSAAIDVLAPFISGSPTVDTASTLTANDTGLAYANYPSKIWYRYSDSESWQITTDWTYSGGVIYFYSSFGMAVDIKIMYLSEYTITTIADIPREATIPLIDFACSEFASMLAGSKSHFTAYQQNSGARGVDSMTDLSNFYEGRGMARAERIADAEGLL